MTYRDAFTPGLFIGVASTLAKSELKRKAVKKMAEVLKVASIYIWYGVFGKTRSVCLKLVLR